MDRQIVWPGAIPLETDLLNTNRNMMVGLAQLAQAILGSSTLADGLACSQTAAPSMGVTIGQGSLYSLQPLDATPFSSLAADTSDLILKQGVLLASAGLQLGPLTAPTSPGTSLIYLVEAAVSEVDANPVLLPFYNSANPAVPFSGPANSGATSFTTRKCGVTLQLKAGVASPTGTQIQPSADAGFIPLYAITLAYGQTTIVNANISVASGAPFISTKLTGLAPLASPALTGGPTAPTAPLSDASNRLATTAFVKSSAGGFASNISVSSGGALTSANFGQVIDIYGSNSNIFTLPPANSAPSGTSIWFVNTSIATATVQCQGADLLYPSSAPVSSIAIPSGDWLMVETNGGGWLALGSATLSSSGLFSGTLGVAGYQKLPSGIVIQWGPWQSASSPGGAVPVTFPIAFPQSGCVALSVVQNNATSSGLNACCWYDNPSRFGANLHSSITTSGGSYIALGF